MLRAGFAVPAKNDQGAQHELKKAAQVLPEELLAQIQEYIDDAALDCIPRAAENKKCWGASTATRRELRERNQRIYAEYLAGVRIDSLADAYFLSPKSIQRIIGQMKKEQGR